VGETKNIRPKHRNGGESIYFFLLSVPVESFELDSYTADLKESYNGPPWFL
jgi:hypothetical protein